MSDDSKRHDVVKILSRISGLGQDEVKGIWKEVKANHERLGTCDLHRFPDLKTLGLRDNAVCQKCGGWMSRVDAGHYQDGVRHAYAHVLSMIDGKTTLDAIVLTLRKELG